MKKDMRNELLERVKAATGDDMLLSNDIWRAVRGQEPGSILYDETPDVTSSIDEAIALAARLLPHRRFALFTDGQGRGPCCLVMIGDDPVSAQEFGATLPLAILAAMLMALTSSNDTQEE